LYPAHGRPTRPRMRDVLAFSLLATYSAAGFTALGDRGCRRLGVEESM
jgi:hypothetical protein